MNVERTYSFTEEAQFQSEHPDKIVGSTPVFGIGVNTILNPTIFTILLELSIELRTIKKTLEELERRQ